MKAATFLRKRSLIERQTWRSGSWRRRAMVNLIQEARAVAVVDSRRVIGWRMTDGSIACKKRRFLTQLQAQETIGAISMATGEHPKPVRPYVCPYCMGWHITSRE